MRDGFRILDADRHVLEPMEMWPEYLPPAFRHRAPTMQAPDTQETTAQRVARLGERGRISPWPVLMLEGRPAMHKLSEHAQIELSIEGHRRAPDIFAGATPEGHLADMDRTGIDVAFLYPTYAMYFVCNDAIDPALAHALVGAYNNWLYDFCSRAPERLHGVGFISCHEPAHMMSELERVCEFGWRAVVLRPNPVRGRILSHPDYAPFFAACERLGIAVAIHEGTHTHLPTTGSDRFETRFALHACSHPMEQMMAFLALVEGGVLSRHPALRVAFLEAGCGWLPYWLWRLDEVEYRHLAGELQGRITMEPSAYFRRQCFVGFEPDEPNLADVLRCVGDTRLLFATDFPHLDHGEAFIESALPLRGQLDDAVLRRMFWDNGAQFYGLPSSPMADE